MRVEVVTIGATLAAEWLKLNRNYRSINYVRVTQYASDMIAGRWTDSHQGLAFNKDGFLVDGQHRLTALILACKTRPGATITTTVTWDASAENCDIHNRRTGGVGLVVKQIVKPEESGLGTRLRSVSNAAFRGLLVRSSTSTESEKDEFIEANLDLMKKVINAAHNMFPSRSEVLAAAVNAVVKGDLKGDALEPTPYDADEVIAHVKRLARDEWTGAGDPLRHLSKLLVKQVGRRHSLHPTAIYAYSVWAFRAALNSKAVGAVREAEYDFGETRAAGAERLRLREQKAAKIKAGRDAERARYGEDERAVS